MRKTEQSSASLLHECSKIKGGIIKWIEPIAKNRRLWYNIKDFGRRNNGFCFDRNGRDTKLSPNYRTVLCARSARMSDVNTGGAYIMDMIKAFTNEQLKKEVPVINIGDTVRIHNKIKEGTRERIQLFEGVVIAKKNGGISETFTVRRIAYGVGVEKTFPIHSPNVVKVDVIRSGKVRRAKLYYVRERVGKAAKIKENI